MKQAGLCDPVACHYIQAYEVNSIDVSLYVGVTLWYIDSNNFKVSLYMRVSPNLKEQLLQGLERDEKSLGNAHMSSISRGRCMWRSLGRIDWARKSLLVTCLAKPTVVEISKQTAVFPLSFTAGLVSSRHVIPRLHHSETHNQAL
jgi:hypothetical protein